MDNSSIESSRFYARIAGLSYIVTMILGIFSVNFVESKLIIPGNNTATLLNITENESLFRIGIASEILMYLLVILLAFSLYVVLMSIDKNLAFDLRSAGLDIVLIFIGMGGTIFCYLFYKSGYIPKILAGWGILTYLVMLVLSFTAILTPITDTTKLIFYAPGGLFELLLGLWLLIKTINFGKTEINRTLTLVDEIVLVWVRPTRLNIWVGYTKPLGLQINIIKR